MTIIMLVVVLNEMINCAEKNKIMNKINKNNSIIKKKASTVLDGSPHNVFGYT